MEEENYILDFNSENYFFKEYLSEDCSDMKMNIKYRSLVDHYYNYDDDIKRENEINSILYKVIEEIDPSHEYINFTTSTSGLLVYCEISNKESLENRIILIVSIEQKDEDITNILRNKILEWILSDEFSEKI